MKNTLLIVGIAFLTVLIVGLAYISQNKDLCCKYELCSNILNICDDDDSDEVQGAQLESNKGDILVLDNIKDGDTVEVTYKIEGSALGSWYYEGVFPVRVLNQQGEAIGTVMATASSDWMTDGMVPFTCVLDVDLEQESIVVIRFDKGNPSGLPDNEDSAKITVTLKPYQSESEKDTISLKVFFGNTKFNPEVSDCSLVYPVTREVDETVAVGRAALEELFKGPLPVELEQEYYTTINEGVEILSLSIEDGIAQVDLSSQLQEGVGGSCMVTTIRAQIEETLKQFPTVDSVIISVDGNSQDILQP